MLGNRGALKNADRRPAQRKPQPVPFQEATRVQIPLGIGRTAVKLGREIGEIGKLGGNWGHIPISSSGQGASPRKAGLDQSLWPLDLIPKLCYRAFAFSFPFSVTISLPKCSKTIQNDHPQLKPFLSYKSSRFQEEMQFAGDCGGGSEPAHGPKVAGSNPAPATNEIKGVRDSLWPLFALRDLD